MSLCGHIYLYSETVISGSEENKIVRKSGAEVQLPVFVFSVYPGAVSEARGIKASIEDHAFSFVVGFGATHISPQGADPHPHPSCTRGKAGRNHLNEEVTPPPLG
jgi:hypothetical protein